jgi:hypothetical protein
VPLRDASQSSVFGLLADLNGGGGHPALFDAGDPSGKRRGMP